MKHLVAVAVAVCALGCRSIDPPPRPFVPPDGGPRYADAWITTTLGIWSSVSGSTRTSVHSRELVLGGDLPAGVNDPRSVYWEFVGRRDGRDVYRLTLVEGEAFLADVEVPYAGGTTRFDVGGVPGRISDSVPR